MRERLSRVAQTEQNRERLLDAARRVFVARGFHAATLDQIADEAGFTKGAIYSQFESKADVFLALLERRIEERARDQLALAERLDGIDDFNAMYVKISGDERSDPAWRLLVIEFRVYAARDRRLRRRYAELHRRTIAGIVALLRVVYGRSGATPPAPYELLAANLIAIENGNALEDASADEPVSARDQGRLVSRMLFPGGPS
jgi:AcrR family transcriptional regulator